MRSACTIAVCRDQMKIRPPNLLQIFLWPDRGISRACGRKIWILRFFRRPLSVRAQRASEGRLSLPRKRESMQNFVFILQSLDSRLCGNDNSIKQNDTWQKPRCPEYVLENG